MWTAAPIWAKEKRKIVNEFQSELNNESMNNDANRNKKKRYCHEKFFELETRIDDLNILFNALMKSMSKLCFSSNKIILLILIIFSCILQLFFYY